MAVARKNEKFLTLRLTPQEHSDLKVKSALKGLSIKRYILNLAYNDDELIIEPIDESTLTDEERKSIKEGREDIKAGNYQTFEEAFKDLL